MEMSEQLEFLRSVFDVQQKVLEHMHDDDRVEMYRVLAEHVGLGNVILFICHENGMVSCTVYTTSTDSVTLVEKPLDAGLGQLFSTKMAVYSQRESIPCTILSELENVCAGDMEGDKVMICSGSADNYLFCLAMIRDSDEDAIQVRDGGFTFMNSMSILMENKILNEKNKYESEHDLLTGLYNRRCYFRRCNEEYKMLASVGVFFMDVNNLKITNDRYGHDAGDALLKRAAESIRAIISENIHGYRMGGDEFIVVAMNCTEDDMVDIQKRWQSALDDINDKYGMEPCVIAVGSAFAKGSFQIEKVCELADDRMYEDKKRKHGGRGR